MCGMCAVRCPIEVTVEDGRVTWLQGNPHDAAQGTSLCPKGAAGLSLEFDDERPQTPLIRGGERGAGQWRRASWDEALDYIAEKLKETIGAFGGRGIALSDRGGPFTDLTRTFVRALGSPNYFSHDAACSGNVHNATRSIYGFGVPQHRRVADGQRGQGVHGRRGERDALHLHRPSRHDHRQQSHPLLAGAPEQ
jgi:thiosulfate reductase/polysulfide reductase chain A